MHRSGRPRWVSRVAVSLVFGSWCLGACTTDGNHNQDVTTTVVMVRHAEKADWSADPPLSAEGETRARKLAHVLGEAPIDAIYSTPFLRTQNTARPLAESLGLEVRIIEAGDTYANDMAELVFAEHEGELVVIVSHSNTVPELVGALGYPEIPTIEDDEYDDLYILTITGSGSTSLLSLRYGEETP